MCKVILCVLSGAEKQNNLPKKTLKRDRLEGKGKGEGGERAEKGRSGHRKKIKQGLPPFIEKYTNES